MIIHDYRSKKQILSWSLLTTIILGTEFEPSTFVSRESIAKKTKIRYEVIKSGRKVSKVDTHCSKLKRKGAIWTKYLASYPILFSSTSQKNRCFRKFIFGKIFENIIEIVIYALWNRKESNIMKSKLLLNGLAWSQIVTCIINCAYL